MKVLKDVGQVLDILSRKLNELRKKFDEADGEEASEISGQEVAISGIAFHIRHAIMVYSRPRRGRCMGPAGNRKEPRQGRGSGG